MCLCEVRLQGDGTAVCSDGIRVAAEQLQRHPEIVLDDRKGGIDRNRPREAGDGIVQPVSRKVRLAEVVAGADRAGVEGNGALTDGYGLRNLPRRLEEVPEVAEDIDRLRHEGENPAHVLDAERRPARPAGDD